jgi:hypothetical protein
LLMFTTGWGDARNRHTTIRITIAPAEKTRMRQNS